MKNILLCLVGIDLVGRSPSSKDTIACPLLVDGGYWQTPLRVRPYYAWRALLYPESVTVKATSTLHCLTLSHFLYQRNSGFSLEAVTGVWRGGLLALWPQKAEWSGSSWWVLKHKKHPHCLLPSGLWAPPHSKVPLLTRYNSLIFPLWASYRIPTPGVIPFFL